MDIECDLPPSHQAATLEEAGRERFRDRYPKLRTQFLHEHRIETKPDGFSKHSAKRGVQAFQFLQDDGKQLVQARVGGYSFNRLAPYSILDDYLPEIERTWRIYIELTSPIQVREIRLRYINRILVPMTGDSADLDKYLRIGPRLPDEEKFTLVGFLVQQAMIEAQTGNQVKLILTAQLPEGQKLPIILDNCAVAPVSGTPDDWPWIRQRIQALRGLLNHIFRRTLTEECLNLFR